MRRLFPATSELTITLLAGLAMTIGLLVPSPWAQLVALFAVAPFIVVLVGPDGNVLLENRKLHRAPGEQITERGVNATLQIGSQRVITAICYEMHFPDIGTRLRGSDLALATVNDTRFGSLLPNLHAADTVYRAAENGITIATAATNGPSFVVRRDGLVVAQPLPVWAPKSNVQRINR